MREKEVRAAELPFSDPQSDNTNSKVTHKSPFVKKVRFKGELFDREYVVWAIKSEYPKFDNTLLTKVMHPDDYGVRLVPGAVRAVLGREDKRRYHKRISARLSDEAFAVLTDHIRRKGFPTVQAWLSELLIHYMKEEGLIDV